jgi:microcystin-dependent protein
MQVGTGVAVANDGAASCLLGEVKLGTGFFAYDVPADGRILLIAQYEALYSLLGTNYGGNGTTTFAIPDLRAVTPKSANGFPLIYSICTVGLYPSRN